MRAVSIASCRVSGVLYVSWSGIAGGAERLLLQFVGAHDGGVVVACPEGALAGAARSAGLTVVTLRPRRPNVRGRDALAAPVRMCSFALEVRSLIRDLAPEVVIAWGTRPALALAWARHAPRRVFMHNDFLPGPLIGAAVRRAAAEFDVVVAPSEAVAVDLDPGRRLGDRLVVVRPGVTGPGVFGGPPADRAPVVVVLGAVIDWKRPDLALSVHERVRAVRPDVRLRFVGAPLDPASRAASLVRAAAGADGSGVSWAGWVDDVGAELARATCLLHCAEREPFGFAVAEALAAGRPVVVPASAGPAEIADSSCGVFYAPGDAAGAASAILGLLSEPARARALGESGRARMAAAFGEADARGGWLAAVGGSRGAGGRGSAAGAGVAVVTVTHNSSSYIGGLMRSVTAWLPGARVVVVDNASTDDSVALAVAAGATVIELEENAGFARACNIGVRTVQEPVVALLNPDVELVDASLASLAVDSSLLIAPLVLRGDGRRQDSVHPAPVSWASLAFSVVSPGLVPGVLASGVAPWRARSPRRVGWAVGCALLGSTAALRALGPFEESFFMYGEDLDLGLRARAAGVEIWFRPDARVVHHGAHASEGAFGGEPLLLLAVARRRAVRRSLGRRGLFVDDALQRLTFLSRVLARRILRRDSSRERAQLAALREARRA
jgi:N-acetylglucosaminyl-diphospho-decaprenol L-rhamnosyltransferase